MKKLVFLLVFMLVSLSASAQIANNGGVLHRSEEEVITSPDGQHITIDHNSYAWRPFNDAMGRTVYGSRYRKAKSNLGWGVFLAAVAAPVGCAFLIRSIDMKEAPMGIIGGAIMAGGLGAGIPLWIKGRRDLDWMLDDYTKRYAPKPYGSSLTVGPTMNGMGLAFNF